MVHNLLVPTLVLMVLLLLLLLSLLLLFPRREFIGSSKVRGFMSGTFVLQKKKNQSNVRGTLLHITRKNKYEIYARPVWTNLLTQTTECLFINPPAIQV